MPLSPVLIRATEVPSSDIWSHPSTTTDIETSAVSRPLLTPPPLLSTSVTTHSPRHHNPHVAVSAPSSPPQSQQRDGTSHAEMKMDPTNVSSPSSYAGVVDSVPEPHRGLDPLHPQQQGGERRPSKHGLGIPPRSPPPASLTTNSSTNSSTCGNKRKKVTSSTTTTATVSMYRRKKRRSTTTESASSESSSCCHTTVSSSRPSRPHGTHSSNNNNNSVGSQHHHKHSNQHLQHLHPHHRAIVEMLNILLVHYFHKVQSVVNGCDSLFEIFSSSTSVQSLPSHGQPTARQSTAYCESPSTDAHPPPPPPRMSPTTTTMKSMNSSADRFPPAAAAFAQRLMQYTTILQQKVAPLIDFLLHEGPMPRIEGTPLYFSLEDEADDQAMLDFNAITRRNGLSAPLQPITIGAEHSPASPLPTHAQLNQRRGEGTTTNPYFDQPFASLHRDALAAEAEGEEQPPYDISSVTAAPGMMFRLQTTVSGHGQNEESHDDLHPLGPRMSRDEKRLSATRSPDELRFVQQDEEEVEGEVPPTKDGNMVGMDNESIRKQQQEDEERTKGAADVVSISGSASSSSVRSRRPKAVVVRSRENSTAESTSVHSSSRNNAQTSTHHAHHPHHPHHYHASQQYPPHHANTERGLLPPSALHQQDSAHSSSHSMSSSSQLTAQQRQQRNSPQQQRQPLTGSNIMFARRITTSQDTQGSSASFSPFLRPVGTTRGTQLPPHNSNLAGGGATLVRHVSSSLPNDSFFTAAENSGGGLMPKFSSTPRGFASSHTLVSEHPFLQLASLTSGASARSIDTGGAYEIRETEKLEKSVEEFSGFKLINNYVMLETIGEGACGKVKLAFSLTKNISVAIKIVRRGVGHGGKATRIGRLMDAKHEALQHEIAVMKKLRHKNIVSLYEVIDDPEAAKLYLVMQYVDRGSIGKVHADGSCTTIPPTRLARIGRQVAAGLEYLHNHGVIHRDIKPENILMDSDDRVFLSDFGVCDSYYATHEGSVHSNVVGTPMYLAPELLHRQQQQIQAARRPFTENEAQEEEEESPAAAAEDGEDDEDGHPAMPAIFCRRTMALDIWAFGVTLYVLLVGQLPWKDIADLAAHAHCIPYPPERVPPEWVVLLSSMLCMNPEKRPTARSVRRGLKKILFDEQIAKGGNVTKFSPKIIGRRPSAGAGAATSAAGGMPTPFSLMLSHAQTSARNPAATTTTTTTAVPAALTGDNVQQCAGAPLSLTSTSSDDPSMVVAVAASTATPVVVASISAPPTEERIPHPHQLQPQQQQQDYEEPQPLQPLAAMFLQVGKNDGARRGSSDVSNPQQPGGCTSSGNPMSGCVSSPNGPTTAGGVISSSLATLLESSTIGRSMNSIEDYTTGVFVSANSHGSGAGSTRSSASRDSHHAAQPMMDAALSRAANVVQVPQSTITDQHTTMLMGEEYLVTTKQRNQQSSAYSPPAANPLNAAVQDCFGEEDVIESDEEVPRQKEEDLESIPMIAPSERSPLAGNNNANEGERCGSACQAPLSLLPHLEANGSFSKRGEMGSSSLPKPSSFITTDYASEPVAREGTNGLNAHDLPPSLPTYAPVSRLPLSPAVAAALLHPSEDALALPRSGLPSPTASARRTPSRSTSSTGDRSYRPHRTRVEEQINSSTSSSSTDSDADSINEHPHTPQHRGRSAASRPSTPSSPSFEREYQATLPPPLFVAVRQGMVSSSRDPAGETRCFVPVPPPANLHHEEGSPHAFLTMSQHSLQHAPPPPPPSSSSQLPSDSAARPQAIPNEDANDRTRLVNPTDESAIISNHQSTPPTGAVPSALHPPRPPTAERSQASSSARQQLLMDHQQYVLRVTESDKLGAVTPLLSISGERVPHRLLGSLQQRM